MIRLPLGNILLPILLSLLGPSHCWWHFGAKQPQTPSAPHNHGQLSLPSPALPELPEGVNAADLRMPGVSPQMNESYLCSAFPLNSDRDHFIVGFEPVPTSHHIHHMIVYGCELPGSGDEAWDCGEMASSRGRYSHSPVCSSQPDIIYAWAHDAPELILPEGSHCPAVSDGTICYFQALVFALGAPPRPNFSLFKSIICARLKTTLRAFRIIHTEQPQPREASTLLLATDGRIAPTKNEQLEVACVVDEPAVLHPFAFRVHTHRHGRKVAGWTVQEDPISGTDRWTMLGQRDPQLPQLFQPVANQSIIISQGDVLAARCTMENGEKREIKIGPTGEDEMCNFYLMYWTENGQNLEQNACFSPGPPEYRWTKNAGLNHTPKRK
ncbi:hypothetical protein GPALN_003643 [Globodera pallida]|nr:hypothetical protein GPALN_003643 [Globodera pallida]